MTFFHYSSLRWGLRIAKMEAICFESSQIVGSLLENLLKTADRFERVKIFFGSSGNYLVESAVARYRRRMSYDGSKTETAGSGRVAASTVACLKAWMPLLAGRVT